MKRARKAPEIPLADLRFQHLLGNTNAAPKREVNLKVPSEMVEQVREVAKLLSVSRTATVIALLNEGLQSILDRGLAVLTSPKSKA